MLAWQTLSKTFEISRPAAGVGPDLFETLAIHLSKTVRRSAVDRQDLKP